MPIFTKESLELLRQRIDLIEVLSPYIDLKKSGAAYKAICPFHDEKTPSLMIQKGDHHYHCFGCGAHGDAIQFLMTHSKMSFLDAVENLAQRFNVPLETVEGSEKSQGPNKTVLKAALEHACQLFHFLLLHTQEGHQALEYLYSRGIDLDFIRQFQIGYSPKAPGVLRQFLHHQSIKDSILVEVGLISESSPGRFRDFFSDRIMFPIRDPQGAVIAFSGRKFKEETFGGKYVNTSETALFKKSRVLFGLNYCRKRIAKERKVLIVEGQLDALRLIHHGFTITVAGQGTAFGEGHAKELINLGVNQVFIATDADNAGNEAACKIGHLFQREGIEVFVVELPPQGDPDTFLCEHGPEAFLALMEKSPSYLEFLVKHRSRTLNMDSPAGKNELVQELVKQIRSWNHTLMVHESLRKLAHLVRVPEETIGVGQEYIPNLYIKRSSNVGLHESIDPNKILEFDVLRWLILLGKDQQDLVEMIKVNVIPEDFKLTTSRAIYEAYLECFHAGRVCDLLSIAAVLDESEAQQALSEILQRKVNLERLEDQFKDSIQRILDRNWMEQREQIRIKILEGQCSDEEEIELTKRFDELRRNPPKLKVPGSYC
ncbi:MAG: DNA primase [Parachlamydiaceae bacterium]